jgi:GT2 family glycosyltransferase
MDMPRARVWVANVNPGKVATEFADSLATLISTDIQAGLGLFQGKLDSRSGVNVSKPRNELVARFLDQTDGEWLLFLDSDMVFPPDTILRLLLAAQAADTKIISGLCVMVTADGPIPTLYLPADAPTDVTRVMLDAPDDQILQVFATGAACLMIHREVLERIREECPDGERDFCWFQEKVINTRWCSEDITFCLRAYELGYPVFVDTTLSIGHAKDGRVWHARDIGRIGIEPPPLVAVIPMKDKIALTRALVDQLLDQGECAEIVVCDNGSNVAERHLLDGMEVTVLDCPGLGIHEMWNRAAEYAISDKKHRHRTRIAFLNNDIRIGDKFMSTLSKAFDETPGLQAVSANYDSRKSPDPVVLTEDICAGRYDGTGGLAGFAFMVRGDWFTSGYRFPEVCKWWYGDNDLVTAVVVGGGKVGIAVGAEVEHLDGGSKTAGDWFDPEWTDLLEADKAAFDDLWRRRREALAERDQVAEWDPTALAGAPT